MEYSVQFSSVTQLCPTLRPMNRSMSGLSVHHHLPEFTQTHVHRVSDAIKPSHSLSSPSPPAPNPPSIRVFFNESTLLMRWPEYWSFSFSILSKEGFGIVNKAENVYTEKAETRALLGGIGGRRRRGRPRMRWLDGITDSMDVNHK